MKSYVFRIQAAMKTDFSVLFLSISLVPKQCLAQNSNSTNICELMDKNYNVSKKKQ